MNQFQNYNINFPETQYVSDPLQNCTVNSTEYLNQVVDLFEWKIMLIFFCIISTQLLLLFRDYVELKENYQRIIFNILLGISEGFPVVMSLIIIVMRIS